MTRMEEEVPIGQPVETVKRDVSSVLATGLGETGVAGLVAHDVTQGSSIDRRPGEPAPMAGDKLGDPGLFEI